MSRLNWDKNKRKKKKVNGLRILFLLYLFNAKTKKSLKSCGTVL